MQLYRAAPVGLVASMMVGMSNGAFLGLGPLSAAGNGLSVEKVALFMSGATLAGALVQWPVGRLSDRLDRRIVLLALLIGAAVIGVLLWLFARNGWLLLSFGVLFGALALPCYSLAAAHAYDKTAASDMVPTAATILLANAVGAAIGPLIASLVMAALGPRALFLFTAAAQGLLAVYVFYRTTVQAALHRAREDRIRSRRHRAGRRRGHRRAARSARSLGGGAGALRPPQRRAGGERLRWDALHTTKKKGG